MMASWLSAGWAAHKLFTRPATTVVFQSENENRAVLMVDYVRTLWEQSMPALRQRWLPISGRQSYNLWRMGNGSSAYAIPGDPDQIRSLHPTIVILDEAAIMTRGEQAFYTAVATRCRSIFCISSAKPGWYQYISESATPVNWPEYEGVAA
jgi:hypothetical protein